MLDQASLDTLFFKARTHSYWLEDRDITDDQLQQIHDMVKMGPTSANCQPVRIVFVRRGSGKERLKPFLAEGNIEKTMKAPVTAIIAHDPKFYNELPNLYPHADAKSWFDSNETLANETAFRNGTLQGAYLIMAARAIGLDCGPMSGFDSAGVDAEFFRNTGYKSNFLCNLGYGDPSRLHPRSPRPEFNNTCQIA